MSEPRSPDVAERPSAPEPSFAIILALLLLATLLPRVGVFGLNENLHGDAVSRTELAQRWLSAPHWIRSYSDGAYQFGPLHIYLLGIALALVPDAESAGRWLSLLFGVLSVIPLYLLTRRLFGWKAGVAAGLGFAGWGMHIQMSTTAASEALGLFLVLWALALFAQGLEEGRFGPFGWAAVVLNLAAATRYDAWLLMPLLTFVLFFSDEDRVAAITRAVLFGLLCLPFPLIWMQGNEMDTGSALTPLLEIEKFHHGWAQAAIGRFGTAGFRAMNVFFWPGAALLTLSPLLALLGMAGMAYVVRRRREHRWLVWVAVVPAAYFTARAVLLLNFVPLGRFTVDQVALVLPFLGPGFALVAQRLSRPAQQALVAVTAMLALAVPAWVGLVSWHAEEGVGLALGPVSPVTTNPPSLMAVARYLKAQAAQSGAGVILDADEPYHDMQIAFFAHLDEPQLARVRWPNFPAQLQKVHAEYLVRMDGGQLEHRADFDAREGRVALGEEWFEALPGFTAPYHVYRRVHGAVRPAEHGTADLPRERALPPTDEPGWPN